MRNLALIFAFVSSVCLINGQNIIDDPSFEVSTGTGNQTFAKLWTDCYSGQGEKSVYIYYGDNVRLPKASDGGKYMAFKGKRFSERVGGSTFSGDNFFSKQAVSQKLSQPMQAGVSYDFKVDLIFIIELDILPRWWGTPGCYGAIQIWGSNSICGKKEILWRSGEVTHTNWKTYSACITPSANYSHIMIEKYIPRDCPDYQVPNSTTNKVSATYSIGFDDMALIPKCEDCKGNTNLKASIPSANLTCGGSTTLTVNAWGGVSGYSYKWNTGEKTKDIMINSPGKYSVTVYSGNCSVFKSINIQAVGPTAKFLAPERCEGQRTRLNGTWSSGDISTWEWDFGDGATSTEKDYAYHNYKAGTYTATLKVTDAGGCSSSYSEQVIVHGPPKVTVSSQDANCGKKDGEVSVTGQAGYTYQWNNGETTAKITGLDAGIYTVKVTNTNGCSVTKQAEVKSTSGLGGSVKIDHVTCYGGNDGKIEAYPTGGSTPYKYQWDNGQTTQFATGLVAGPHKITVTDQNGCTIGATLVVNEPDSLYGTTLPTNHVSCNGGSDGTAIADISGGTPPYTYEFSNGQTTAVATGLTAGPYTLTITDSLGCVLKQNFTVNEPSSVLSLKTTTVDINCANSGSGEATVVASGGTAPYTYEWNDAVSQTTSTATGLDGGQYSVVVTDSLGCMENTSVTINKTGSISTNVKLVTAAECDRQGGVKATAEVTVTGGSGKYSYQWDDPGNQTTAQVLLPAGTFHVSVQDDKGCRSVDSVTVEKLIKITVVDKKEPSCPTCNDGEITISVGGNNTPPYTYRWNDANQQTAATATGLSNGTYQVTVFDDVDCFDHLEITLGATGIEDYSFVQEVNLYPNPVSNLLYISTGKALINISTSIYDMSGRVVFRDDNTDFLANGLSQIDVSGLENGLYFVKISMLFNSGQGIKELVKKIQVSK